MEGFSRQIISNYVFHFFDFLFFLCVVVFYFRYNKCIENYLDAIFTYYLRKIINEKNDEILNFKYILNKFFLKMKKERNFIVFKFYLKKKFKDIKKKKEKD